MVILKTSRELQKMREAGRISANALKLAGQAVEPGVSTAEIDRIVRKYIEEQGAVPSFLGYGGFKGSACISINEEVVHGIPSKKRILKRGDVVSIDVGAFIDGFHGDNAYTFACGDISPEVQALLDATKESLQLGIKQAQAGNRLCGSKLCRSSQLLGGTGLCRPRRRCEITRRSKRTEFRYTRQGCAPATGNDYCH